MPNKALITEYEARLAQADALLQEKLKRIQDADPALKEKENALKVIEDKIAEKSVQLEEAEKPSVKLFSVLFADGSAGVFPEAELESVESISEEQFDTLTSLLSGDFENATDIDPLYSAYPDESKKWKGMCHSHIRGRSVHLDFRLQVSKDYMVGWTLYIPKGLSKDPETFAEAKALNEKEIMPIVRETMSNSMKKFNCGTKEPEPIEWAIYEGTVQPGQVGATKKEHGHFIIIDSFEVQFGASKSYFHEYFCDGKIFNGRIVFRLLENKEEWKRTDEGLLTWFCFNALKSPTPYVLSTRAVKKLWIPPYGSSALPQNVRNKIPERFQYWKIKDASRRREVRDELVEEIKKKLLKLDSITQGDFKFLKQTWRGQKVIRAGPSRTLYYFILKQDKTYFSLALNTSLLASETATGLPFRYPTSLWTAEGELPPGTKLNPTKATPSKIEVLDQGEASLFIEDNIKKFYLEGKKLKGVWMAFQQKGSNLWIIEKSESPELKK